MTGSLVYYSRWYMKIQMDSCSRFVDFRFVGFQVGFEFGRFEKILSDVFWSARLSAIIFLASKICTVMPTSSLDRCSTWNMQEKDRRQFLFSLLVLGLQISIVHNISINKENKHGTKTLVDLPLSDREPTFATSNLLQRLCRPSSDIIFQAPKPDNHCFSRTSPNYSWNI